MNVRFEAMHQFNGNAIFLSRPCPDIPLHPHRHLFLVTVSSDEEDEVELEAGKGVSKSFGLRLRCISGRILSSVFKEPLKIEEAMI